MFFQGALRTQKHLKVTPSSIESNPYLHIKTNYKDLVQCDTALWDKRACQRTSEAIPVRLPSQIFAEEMAKVEESSLQLTQEPQESLDKFDCQAYFDHPVVQLGATKGLHWTRVIPAALYIDGVAYTKHDAFHGFFLRDLRTGLSYLMVLLRNLITVYSQIILESCL